MSTISAGLRLSPAMPIPSMSTPTGRRCTFRERMVVHGQHILLWALDELCARGTGRASRVHPGDLCQACPHRRPGRGVAVAGPQARPNQGAAAKSPSRCAFNLAANATQAGPSFEGDDGSRDRPRAARSPIWRACRNDEAASPCAVARRRGSPRLTASLGSDRVIGLAAISTLVGMDCPGLYSMLSKVVVRTRFRRRFAARLPSSPQVP